MNLQYSEEQRLLQDSVHRFVAQGYPADLRRAVADSPTRSHEPTWRAMAEFGWLALPLPEQHGGLGGSAVDVGIVMEGLGRGLLLEPFQSSQVLAGSLISTLGTDRHKATLLPRLAGGDFRAVFAHLEAGRSPYDLQRLDTQALRTASGWRLSGRKPIVVDGPGADALLVSASLEGGNLAVFVVPPQTPGLTIDSFETLDGRRAMHLALDDVALDADACLDGGGNAREGIELALDLAVAAVCAEAVGCMQVLLDATIEYTKTRVQFGQPLASNQVLRHRMVNMAVQLEEARAMALRAALYCDARQVGRAARGRAVSGARLKVADAARFVAEGAVQLHGAMGVTEELAIGAYFKRLLTFDMYLGTRSEHLSRCIALGSTSTEEA